MRALTFPVAVLTALLVGLYFGSGLHAPAPGKAIDLQLAAPIAAQKEPDVWNRVNIADMTKTVVASAGIDGKILLHLGGAKVQKDIDNLLVALYWTSPADTKDGGGAAPVILEVADWSLGSKEFAGDMIWDATGPLQALFEVQKLSDIRVIFHVTARNHSIHISDESVTVEWPYFEVFDAAGLPVLQERKPKPSPEVDRM